MLIICYNLSKYNSTRNIITHNTNYGFRGEVDNLTSALLPKSFCCLHVSGLLKDSLGSYNYGFYICGTTLIITSTLFLIVLCTTPTSKTSPTWQILMPCMQLLYYIEKSTWCFLRSNQAIELNYSSDIILIICWKLCQV